MVGGGPEILEGVITQGNMGRDWFAVASTAVEQRIGVDVVGICRSAGFHLYDVRTDETRIMSAPTRSMFDHSPHEPQEYVDAIVGSISLEGVGIYRPSSLWQIRNEKRIHPMVATLGWIDYFDARDIIHISLHPSEV